MPKGVLRDMKRLYKKRSTQDLIADIINVILMGIFALLCLYPFYYILINSISNNDAVMANQVWLVPKDVHLDNYISTFRLKSIFNATLMSVLRTVIGTFATILSCAVLGYAMTKREYWHRKFWYRFLLITMYFNAGLIPSYLNVKQLGLLNNFLVYILPAMAAPYYMILMKTYIESIPQSMEEAAVLDGAGYFDRFVRVIIPLSKPILATIAIFAAVGQWNSYMDTVLFTTGAKLQTLQSLLQQYITRASLIVDMLQKSGNSTMTAQIANSLNVASVRYTITAIVMLPVLLIYPFFQRYFIKGIMIGAIKG